ncbi:MAG: hypothetical protein JWP18_746 [Solirubrobacterales bacterium]|nr:hypothetical protein [Solirubrobacterales bacterium]
MAWTRVGRASWRCAPATGDLAEDGAIVAVTRTASVPGPCPVCGRRRRLWQLDVELPKPFPVLGPLGAGCTRGHALKAVPSSWAEVAALYAAAAETARSREPLTVWDERLANLRARQAARATWLSGSARPARRLALQLWSIDDRLDVAATDAVVTAVLSAPN